MCIDALLIPNVFKENQVRKQNIPKPIPVAHTHSPVVLVEKVSPNGVLLLILVLLWAVLVLEIGKSVVYVDGLGLSGVRLRPN